MISMQPGSQSRASEEAAASLRSPSVQTRLEAIRTLRIEGEAGVDSLIIALQDRERSVRLAAARGLREVGDERAVQPLIQALRHGCKARSSSWPTPAGWAALAFVSFFLAVPDTDVTLKSLLAALTTLILILAAAWKSLAEMRERGEARRVFTSALVGIAERCPTPELLKAVPHLHGLALNVVQEERTTRRTTRAAAQRILSLTERVRDLPVASASPEPEGALPLASGPPATDPASLPRASAGEASARMIESRRD
jgi:HEAT repeat protein